MKNFFSLPRIATCITVLLLAATYQAYARITVDNFNTGPFSQIGAGSQDNIVASGAIGGLRDIQMSNTNGSGNSYCPY